MIDAKQPLYLQRGGVVMMSSGMIDSLIVYGPIIVLIVACIGIVWSVLKKEDI